MNKRVFEDRISSAQELKVGPGNYVLRLGVMDRSNQKIGTVGIPADDLGGRSGK